MKKFIVCLFQIALQLCLPFYSIAQVTPSHENASFLGSSSAVDRLNGSQLDKPGETALLNQGARMLTSGHVADSARTLAVGEASAGLQQWLNGFGTARIQLNMDRHGNWSHSSGDLLVPLYDNGQSLLFLQSGVRKPSDRLITNLGYGIRTFWRNGWMFGGNVFFDDDFTGHNRRVGIGGEAWRDYLRLSANTYLGSTGWHISRDFDGTWQEKPADGYDLRVEGWLPSYPSLGGKLEWEQYNGQQVALSDKDHLQHNPHAVTAGVEYTPVPLITLSADQRQGRGMHDTQVALDVNWGFGHDWRWQLDPANVQTMRTLSGSRYDLVNRNNEIVLQYRKNPEQVVAHLLLTRVIDNSPADGITRNVLQVLATNRTGQPVRRASVSWLTSVTDGSVSLAEGASETDDNGMATVTLASTKVQAVPLTVSSGGASSTEDSHFTVVAVNKIALSVTQDNAVADGSSMDTIEATLTDSNGRPVAGQTVTWKAPDRVNLSESSSKSDASGKATVNVTSVEGGSAVLSATSGNQTASGTVHFTGNAANAKVAHLTVITDGSPADGKAANVAQVMITDANGSPLPGQAVIWNADKSTVTFGQSAATDSSGRTTVSYTDTAAETLALTATLSNGSSATEPSQFVSDESRSRLKNLTVTSGAQASGSDTNMATATVTDTSGNPLVNTTVTFSSTGSSKLAATAVNTDNNGQAQVALTDTVAETVQVTAKLASGSSLTKDSSFTADIDSAELTVNATSGAMADGTATNTVTVTLKDKSGAAISGQAVTLSVDGGAKLSATAGSTDSSGQVIVTLTDTSAETVAVTAALGNGKKATAQTAFITYAITVLSASTTSVKANGSSSSTLTATVKDGSGTAVVNTPVAFTVTGNAKLSVSNVNTDSKGQAWVTLTDTTGETVTVTARASGNSNDAGKTQSVTFTESVITDILVSGTNHTFSVDEGFPETGFNGAQMAFYIDGSTDDVTDYTWSSNRSWASVNQSGVVTLNGTEMPASPDVIITAKSISGGKTLTYSFTIKKWFTQRNLVSYKTVETGCDFISGSSVPSQSDLTQGTVSVVGLLFGEWRDSPALIKGHNYTWDKETATTYAAGEDIELILHSGQVVHSGNPSPLSSVMCMSQ